MAGGLLRRAVLHASRPLSAAHLDAILRARVALAELGAGADSGSGGSEGCALLEHSAAMLAAVALEGRGLAGEVVSTALAHSMRETKRSAAESAAHMLRRLGRSQEAQALLQRTQGQQ